MSQRQIQVLILLFEGFNTLDVNGPLEVLCNSGLRKGKDLWCPFKLHFAAPSSDPVKAFEFIRSYGSMTYEDATRMIKAKEIDVLITPGYAPPKVFNDLEARNDPVFEPLRAFLALDSGDKERWMISICVGAFLNNHVGAFKNKTATTHFLALESIAEKPESKSVNWVRKRWVDGGTTENNIRIVSAGGISCGIDCMLWFLDQILPGEQGLAGSKVAYIMDYVWEYGPKPTTN